MIYSSTNKDIDIKTYIIWKPICQYSKYGICVIWVASLCMIYWLRVACFFFYPWPRKSTASERDFTYVISSLFSSLERVNTNNAEFPWPQARWFPCRTLESFWNYCTLVSSNQLYNLDSDYDGARFIFNLHLVIYATGYNLQWDINT